MFKSDTIKNSFVFVGTLIGAGFASGKEIAVFFAGQNIIAPILSCLILAVFAVVFYCVGVACNNALSVVFKRSYLIVEIFIVLANFVIFATMIAASNTVTLASYFSGNLGIIIALISLSVVVKGGNLGTLNTIVIPFVVILIWILFFKSNSYSSSYTGFSIDKPILYAMFNLLSAGLILAKQPASKNCSVLHLGVWIFIIMLTLVLPVYLMIQLVPSAVMPIQTIADNFGLSTVGGIIILLAIFTTATSSLQLIVGDKSVYAPIIVAAAMFVSLLGFDTLVVSFYPIIGILGSIIAMIFALYALLNRRKLKACILGHM